MHPSAVGCLLHTAPENLNFVFLIFSALVKVSIVRKLCDEREFFLYVCESVFQRNQKKEKYERVMKVCVKVVKRANSPLS